MKNPKFLFQAGPVLTTEKLACSSAGYDYMYCSLSRLPELTNLDRLSLVPLGSVEFVKAYCEKTKLSLPDESLTYYEPAQPYIKRKIRRGVFSDALNTEFVKPTQAKTFTGDLKSNLLGHNIAPNTPVWISEPVSFDVEYRFYIQNYVTNWEILGWTRYDSNDTPDIRPDVDQVDNICKAIYHGLGPNAYTIDIGYRPDLKEFDVVELNDAWALGFYQHNTPESSPPSPDQYAQMLITRWTQILFSNLV